MIKGHVTICKVYSDGTQEIVLDKANIITAGLGSSYVDILQGGGSRYPDDYAPAYFQLGTSTIDYDTDSATSSYFYQLSTPLPWSSYGEDTDLSIAKRYRGFNASSTTPLVADATWGELFLTSALLSACTFSGSDEYFSYVEGTNITKFFMDSFEVAIVFDEYFSYTQGRRITKFYMDSLETEIVLDENTANGQAITEVGLFAKNPKGLHEDSPVLMAYRSFSAVNKEKIFSLVIHWTIGFLGLSTEVYPMSGDRGKPSPISVEGLPVASINFGYPSW